jgi:hypothetical protein
MKFMRENSFFAQHLQPTQKIYIILSHESLSVSRATRKESQKIAKGSFALEVVIYENLFIN